MADHPNVKFQWGTQAKLDTLTSFAEGSFYLTTDSDRLYFAQSASELVLLNSIVKHVARVSALPSFATATVGDFYYAELENILCTKRSGTSEWTQINPNTSLDPSALNTVVSTVTDGFRVTSTVEDSAQNQSVGSFDLIGGTNVTLSKSGNAITISSVNDTDTTYDLEAKNNKLVLTPSSGTADEIALAGTGIASVTSANDTITVNVPVPTISVSTGVNANGALTTVVGDSNASADGSDTITPKIKLDSSATANVNGEYTFVGGSGSAAKTPVLTLPVYTKAETDTAISNAAKAMDSMTYKGTVDSSNATTKLASTGNVGDTYKAASAISITGVSAKVGDLIIAKGTDGNVTWDVVPSGDDQVVDGSATGTQTIVSDDSGTIIGVKVDGGTHIDATGSYNSTTKVNTITVAQKDDYTAQNVSGSANNVTLSQGGSTATSAEFEAITAIQTDAYGNVVDGSIQKKKITVVDSHANIASVSYSTSATNNVATISTTVTDDDDISKSGNFKLQTTGSIAITAPAAGQVNIDLVWGTF